MFEREGRGKSKKTGEYDRPSSWSEEKGYFSFNGALRSDGEE